jgi:hypothetical protein
VGPHALAAADLNGDGRPDLAVTSSLNNDVSVRINLGDGTLAPAVSYTAGKKPSSLAAADLNDDGRLDLAIANTGSNDVTRLLNLGDGTFVVGSPITSVASPSFIAAADLTGDGAPDLVIASQANDSVGVLHNLGSSLFAPAVNYAAGYGPYLFGPASIVAADLNADGSTDLAITNVSRDNVTVLLNTCLF